MHTDNRVALMYAMDLYIDVYTAYTYIYMCICKLHTCVKPVSLIFCIS